MRDLAIQVPTETLCEADDFRLSRGGWKSRESVLILIPVDERPGPALNARLDHEYAMRGILSKEWAAVPLAIEQNAGKTALILADPGGIPLSRIIAPSLEVETGIKAAIAIAEAIAGMHRAGLIHKDIKPTNILIDPATHQAWLTGFGVATLLPRQHQEPEPLEFIDGTFAYMAPEQTGRMNRSIDSRADLYALGVTLYEMFTGELPFMAEDPVEWVHCHVARKPVSPLARRPDLPKLVSDVIMRLLAKRAEERYQTAEGLSADLRQALSSLQQLGKVPTFRLGGHDHSGRLTIPEKLYGRERQSETLMAAVDRVLGGGPAELVLVSGYSGIGKSALVQETQKAIVQPPGIFMSAKYDQYKRDIPYATLAQAFGGYIRQILSRPESEVVIWRREIEQALGVNGRIIVELIPELQFLIGPQPEVPEQPANEAKNRLHSVFCHFVMVFARPEHPLVLFLDDLQWHDQGSLELLSHLLRHPDTRHFLLIGAYRDNEVPSTHPLMLTIKAIRETAVAVTEIVLSPLSLADLQRMTADSLPRSGKRAAPLARLIHEKTDGNPFFAIQFLTMLHDEGELTFDLPRSRWTWDIARIRAKDFTDNVVELMVGKLHRLPEASQAVLRHLACLGNRVRIADLAVVHDRPQAAIMADLEDAVRSGFLLTIGTDLKFAHDRIHEAAYALIPAERRAAEHLRIGRLLVSSFPAGIPEDAVFDIVNHLNRGIALIERVDERRLLCRLNRRAGSKAKASAAYASARSYLAQAVSLLDAEEEVGHSELFDLMLELAECEFLVGDLETAERRFDRMLDLARSKVERTKVYHICLRLYFSTGRIEHALEVVLKAMQMFGVSYPDDDAEINRLGVSLRASLSGLLAGRSIAELVDSPVATDQDICALIGLMSDAMPLVFVARGSLVLVHVLTGLELSLRHGNTKDSCPMYSSFGAISIGIFEDIQGGYEFSELALRLNEKFGDMKERGRLLFSHGTFAHSWRRPYSETVALLESAYAACVEVGNLFYAAAGALVLGWTMFERGEPLSSLLPALGRFGAYTRQSHNEAFYYVIRTEELMVLTLLGEDVREEDFLHCLNEMTKVGYRTGIGYFHIMRQWLHVSFGRWEEARAEALLAAPVLFNVAGMAVSATHHTAAALAICALHDHTDQERWSVDCQEALADHRRKLRRWAESCPQNFQARYCLVEAEAARIERRDSDAMGHYEDAIRWAGQNGMVHTMALASELAARFYRALGLETNAVAHLRNARDGYRRWGATGLVRNIDRRYPWIGGGQSISVSFGGRVQDLDLMAVVRASQAVSGEIKLTRLIETLLVTVVEDAGAGRGLLILPRGKDYMVAAEAASEEQGIVVKQPRSPLSSAILPISVLQYVIRTGERVLLGEAASTGSEYSSDEYIHSTKVNSVLCLPLVKQTKTVGILYLENRLVSGAFTAERIAVLDLLATQAAISIENALLYAELQEHQSHLEDLIEERTQELVQQKMRLADAKETAENALIALREAQDELIEREKQASLGSVVAGVAHEVNTPLGIGVTAASLIREKVRELAGKFMDNRVTRSEMTNFIATLTNGAEILEANLQRAADMIRNFKQVAVDQSMDGTRRIDLEDYIRSAVLSLGPQIRKSRHSVDIHSDGLIELETFPSAIWQIISNLIVNSMVHAYSPGEQGRLGIRLEKRSMPDMAVITYTDDGKGMSEDVQRRIFEPFFTTRRGEGGSGLGLSIVYSLVTQKLGGTISCKSKPGAGTSFTIAIPLVLPGEAGAKKPSHDA